MSPIRTFLCSIGCAALLAGCLPQPVSPDRDDLEGMVSFLYDGARTGSFHAQGAVENQLPNGVRYGTWSAAFHAGAHRVRLVAFEARGEPNGHVLEIRLGLAVADEIVIDPEGCPPADSDCPAAHFDFHGTHDNLLGGIWSAATYRASGGVIQLTENGNGRRSGRFRFEMVPISGPGTVLRIEEGVFDVPVLYPDFR